MKVKSIALALFVLGITASFTLAAAPVGSSKNNDSTPSSTTTVTASNTVSHGGTLNALSSTSITVDALTCAISTGSPSTTGFKVGDHVGIGCVNGALTVLVELPSSGTSSTDSISALSSTSITVGQLTCAVNSNSPTLTGFTVGERVAAACTNGALVTIVPLPPLGGPIKATIDSITSGAIGYDGFSCLLNSSSPNLAAFNVHEPVYLNCVNGYLTSIVARTTPDGGTTTTTTTTPTTTTTTTPTSGITTTGQGTVTALSPTSITVNTIRTGPLTCALTSNSPSTSSFKVGDYVGLGCGNGVLLVIVPKPGDGDSPAPATAQGPITALSLTSITVGSLTCAVDSTSPSLTGYQLGEQATIGCLNGVLGRIAVAPKLALQLGTITALSTSSITVGSLTCTIDSSSPSLTGFSTGDQVGMVCVDGVLGLIVPLPGAGTNTARKATTLKHDLLLRYSACLKHPGKKGCRTATVRLQRAIRR